jgi:lipopolysaccharide/colanic/teichoic acid biosynthesis glycosyltransferase
VCGVAEICFGQNNNASRAMRKITQTHYNNPSILYVIINLVVNVAIFYFVIVLFPLTSHNPFNKYTVPFYIYLFLWLFCGVALKKYLDFRRCSIGESVKNCIKSDILALMMGFVLVRCLSQYHYSLFVLVALSFLFFIAELFLISVFYTFLEAEEEIQSPQLSDLPPLENYKPREVHPVDSDTRVVMTDYILRNQGEALLDFLNQHTQLFFSSTLLINTSHQFNIEKVSHSRYSTIINLHEINNIREINSFFMVINDRLPKDGLFVGCFESISQRKKRIKSGKNWIWSGIVYANDFLLRRVMSKAYLTREAYFWITNGKDRVLSKAEVYGRIYFSGFEVVSEAEINGYSYFVAKKIKEPIRIEESNHGAIISLRRVGKNGKLIKVYKFRTMHPYSAYLQAYIYNKNNLDKGGKFKQDFRITPLGHLLRKFWLDELPMLANILKGNMKLVGVRPLSKHYFSLYSAELQKQRVQHKPGLLPPFYADMPTTLDEIQLSEKHYLDACEKNGTFVTDLRYLIVISFNIFFKKARSK